MRAEGDVNKQAKVQRDQDEGSSVESGSHFCGGRMQISGKDGGWIGDESNQQEQTAVAEVQARIGAVNVTENGVVMHPHDEDSEEAGDQGEIAGPQLKEGFAEGGGGWRGRRGCGG